MYLPDCFANVGSLVNVYSSLSSDPVVRLSNFFMLFPSVVLSDTTWCIMFGGK